MKQKLKRRPLTAVRRKRRIGSALDNYSHVDYQRSESVDFEKTTNEVDFLNRDSKKNHLLHHDQNTRKQADEQIIVFSAIDKKLKNKLKKKVPLYKDNIMGHVVYQETRSKIIRPCSSKPFYKPNETIVERTRKSKILRIKRDLNREKNKILNEYYKEAKKDVQFFQDKTTFFNKSSASIMGMNKQRDRRLNVKVNNLLSIVNPFTPKTNMFRYTRNTRRYGSRSKYSTHENDKRMKEFKIRKNTRQIQFSRSQSKKKVKIEDLIKFDQFQSQSTPFVHDDNFITLSKVKMK